MSASHKYSSENLNVVIELTGLNSSSSLHAQTGAGNPGVRVKGCDLTLERSPRLSQTFPTSWCVWVSHDRQALECLLVFFKCPVTLIRGHLQAVQTAWSPFLLCLLTDSVGRKRNYHTSPRDFSLMLDSNSIFARIFLWVLTVTWDFVFATSASKLHSISLTSLEDIFKTRSQESRENNVTIMFQSWSDPPLICAATRVRYTIFQLFIIIIILRPVTYMSLGMLDNSRLLLLLFRLVRWVVQFGPLDH